jgi:hypothetical protein
METLVYDNTVDHEARAQRARRRDTMRRRRRTLRAFRFRSSFGHCQTRKCWVTWLEDIRRSMRGDVKTTRSGAGLSYDLGVACRVSTSIFFLTRSGRERFSFRDSASTLRFYQYPSFLSLPNIVYSCIPVMFYSIASQSSHNSIVSKSQSKPLSTHHFLSRSCFESL